MKRKICMLAAFFGLLAFSSAQAQVPQAPEYNFITHDFVFSQDFQNKVDELQKLISQMNEYYTARNYSMAQKTAQQILKLSPNNKIALDMLKKIDEQLVLKSPAYKISLSLKVQQLIKDADEFAKNGNIDTALTYLMEAINIDPKNKTAVEKFMNLLYDNLKNRIETQKLKELEAQSKVKAEKIRQQTYQKIREIQQRPDVIKSIELNTKPGEKFMIMLDTTDRLKNAWDVVISDTTAVALLQKTYFPPVDKYSLGKLIYQFQVNTPGRFTLLFKTDENLTKPKAISYTIICSQSEESTKPQLAHAKPQPTQVPKVSAPAQTTKPLKKATAAATSAQTSATAETAETESLKSEIQLIKTLFNLGLYDDVISKIDNLLANENVSPTMQAEAFFLLAQTYFAKGDTDAALQIYKNLRENNPNSPIAQKASLKLGDIFFTLGNLKDAMRYYIEAKAAPYNKDIAAQAALNVANIFEAMTQYDDAINAYLDVVAKYPKTQFALTALMQVAKIYDFKKRDYYTAFTYYKKILKEFPEVPDADKLKARMTYIQNTYL